MRRDSRSSIGRCIAAASALALALHLPASGGEASFTVDRNIPAGNIELEKIDGNTVYVHQELRDTEGSWFYWAFRVKGAGGRTVEFRFTRTVAVGTRGPCVSLDRGRTWNYSAEQGATRKSFVYAFPADAEEVWFCQTIPYLQSDWDAFLARHEADRGNTVALPARP